MTYLKYWTCFTTFSSGPNVDFEHAFVCLIAFCFIFFSVCYIFFFDEIWKCKEKCLDTLFFYKNFCSWSYVIFKKLRVLFLRNFFKNLLVAGIFLRGCWSWRFWTYIYVLGHSETIPTAADETATGRIYKSLVAWMHIQWFSAGYSEDVCIRTWHKKLVLPM